MSEKARRSSDILSKGRDRKGGPFMMFRRVGPSMEDGAWEKTIDLVL